MQPEHWYFHYDNKTGKYTTKSPHDKKAGFSTSLLHEMDDGHCVRIHAFPSDGMIAFLDAKLEEAESNWQIAQNEIWNNEKWDHQGSYYSEDDNEKR